MNDRIFLSDLAVETVIGVFPHERTAARTLRVDVELVCDLRAASASDALADTVDYAALAARVRQRAAASEFQLLEALAGALADACLEDAHVGLARVTVHKPGAVEHAGDVAVTVERRS